MLTSPKEDRNGPPHDIGVIRKKLCDSMPWIDWHWHPAENRRRVFVSSEPNSLVLINGGFPLAMAWPE